MALVEGRLTRNKCIMCGSNIERANLGNMCNICKDKLAIRKKKKTIKH
ncbi:MAG: hypothetical protein V1900_04560 [Candidatus Aenigmatarchaeota archaeon]